MPSKTNAQERESTCEAGASQNASHAQGLARDMQGSPHNKLGTGSDKPREVESFDLEADFSKHSSAKIKHFFVDADPSNFTAAVEEVICSNPTVSQPESTT